MNTYNIAHTKSETNCHSECYASNPKHIKTKLKAARISLILIITLFINIKTLNALTATNDWPPDIENALQKAGYNRPELEKALIHYQNIGDQQKLLAAQFLIKNMQGHGYTVTSLFDENKNEIPFDALDYPNLNSATQALDEIEKIHGSVDFARKRFDEDLETITAAYLIENIDLAFKAWRNNPWAKDISFDIFCEYILPYRGSNEPVNSWRRECMLTFADLKDQMDNPADPIEAANKIKGIAYNWVHFSDLYYLHPTDQSYQEMKQSGLGRCEDITNMVSYALRANAIIMASDYTPFWANRDNNHAWEVTLDANGKGKAGLSNLAAKVYRKMFSIQPQNLGCIKTESEDVPRWLSGKNYIDVTADYIPTTDITIKLTNDIPDNTNTRFAYICVFNGGEWQAIHWGKINHDNQTVTFTDMGRNIAYLTAYYIDKKLIPAASPFILDKDGKIHDLTPDPEKTIEVEISITTPETPDADTKINKPSITVKPDKPCELFIYNSKTNGWESLGKQTIINENHIEEDNNNNNANPNPKSNPSPPINFKNVPANGLYWLVEEGSRKLERIFTFENGKQYWW